MSPEGVLGRGWCQFQLGNREDRVNPPIEWYIKLVDKATYLFYDAKGANVLLGQLLDNSSRRGDAVSLVDP